MRPTYVGLLEYKRHTSWELCGFQTVTEVFFSFIVPRLLVDQQLLVDNTDSLLTLKIWSAALPPMFTPCRALKPSMRR